MSCSKGVDVFRSPSSRSMGFVGTWGTIYWEDKGGDQELRMWILFSNPSLPLPGPRIV